VCSELFDHTSSLRFLERFTGVKEPNISDWRRGTFGDFTTAFRFDEPAASPPSMPNTGAALSRALYEADRLPAPTFPGSAQAMPGQEKGVRGRVPKGGAGAA
jgi:phospholipase C